MKRDLQNSRAIVTGASSGIGRETALELARHGASVVVVARREDRLRQLVEQIAALGRTAEPVVGDITDPQTRQRAIDAAQAKLGGLDILMNNAGVGAMGLFADADPGRVRRVMEVNFFALVEMTRLALPLLKQGVNPIVVNVSSILGHRGVPHSSEYSASKFAVQGFSEAIRAEFTRLGIDVLVVSPGTTETEFFDRVHPAHDGAQLAETPAGQCRPAWPARLCGRFAPAATRSFPTAGAESFAGSTASRRGWSMD